MFHVPQNCLCFPGPFSFILLFPRSPEINGLIPLFPKTTGRATDTRTLRLYIQENGNIDLSAYVHFEAPGNLYPDRYDVNHLLFA